MLGAREHVRSGAAAERLREPQLLGQQALDGVVDAALRHLAARDGRRQPAAEVDGVGQLDVHPGVQRGDSVADREGEVADDESVEAPALLEDRGEKRGGSGRTTRR